MPRNMSETVNPAGTSSKMSPSRSGNSLAFGFSLAGLVIQVLSSVWMSTMFFFFPNYSLGGGMGWMMGGVNYYRGMMGGGYYGGMMGSYYPSGFGLMAGAWFVSIVLVIALGVIGVTWLSRGDLSNRVTIGSILVIIAAVIAFPTMWGFGIGSVLMLVGGILGLTSAMQSGRT